MGKLAFWVVLICNLYRLVRYGQDMTPTYTDLILKTGTPPPKDAETHV